MSDRVRLHRHPHAVAVALVISLCAAMLVAVPLAAPADAAALAVTITRLYDGTAPFEDWSPGDTPTPTPNGSHDPGDDLDGNNGIVRTLDDVRYRIEYSVNPPLPSGNLVLEVEVTNGGWKDGWVPRAGTCPGGSTFSTNRTLWTCNLGVVSGSSGTVAIDMPAVPPTTVADGSQIQAQVRLTEDGDPLTTQTADAEVTTVSAAPRYEVTKQRSANATVVNNSLGETGLAARYFVGLHAADPDPRGLSALPDPLTVTDNFGVPGAELACYNGLYGALPFQGSKTPANPDRSVSTSHSTCTQTGDALDITWNVNWDRTAPPPTQGSYSPLHSYAHNLIAYDLVTAWLPVATVDAADGTPGDGQGELYAPNAIETSVGGAAAPGTCSTSTWSPDAGTTSSFDPDDISGVSNKGGAVEPFADNGACARYHLNINGTLDFAARGGPDIEVQKTVYAGHTSGADCPGVESATTVGDVTWCVTVTNTGNTSLTDITLDDPDLGLTTGDFTRLSGNPALLGRGDTVTWYVETAASATLDNDVTATGNPSNPFGHDIPGLGDVTDTDNATINVIAPAITIDTTVYTGHDTGVSCAGSELVSVLTGADVTYCFTVTNTGTTHLANIGVDDIDLGIDETDMTLVSGDPTLVAPGGTVTWYHETTTGADLINVADATGEPATAGGTDLTDVADVIDSDSAAINVVAPSVTIDETVYPVHDAGASCSGDELVWYTSTDPSVTYCFEITNTGDTHLSITTIDDRDLGIDGSDLTLLSGNPILLAPGATTVGYYETDGTGDLLNTVDLTANPVASDGTDLTGIADVTDNDTAQVDQVAPAVSIDKTVYAGHDSGAGCTGSELTTVTSFDDVTYCFTVTNSGDTHLGGLSFTDPDLGIDDTDVTVLVQDPVPLAPGASGSAYYETTATADLVNTGSVTGNPVEFDGTDMTGIADVTDDDTAAVHVVTPAITVDETVYAGHDGGASCAGDQTVSAMQDTPVSYCFHITNTGTAYLADVTVTDADLGIDRDDMTVVSGDPTRLAPGASLTLVYETTVDGDLVNTATASGTPTDAAGTPTAGLTPPTDDDTAEIDQINPAIDIEKDSLTPIVPVNNTAEFKITVTNTGDVDLVDVRVSDELVPECARTIGNLAVGKTVTFTCEGPIGATPRMLTKVARATADIAQACSADPCVSDVGKAMVEVVESVLVLEKRALQNEVARGGVATYSFTITNPTRLTIEDVRLIDETFPECSREIGTLGALQTVNYTCDVTTPEQAGELVNKAHVSGRGLTRSYTSYASAAIMIVTTLPGAPLTSVSGGPLAATGADSTTASSTAALLLVLGVLFLATSRRRRQTVERD